MHLLPGVLGILSLFVTPEAATGDSGAVAVWPIDPHPVVAAFDPPGCDFCSGHRGIDVGTLPLQPVRSALPGTVTYAGDLAGRGVVVVDDGTRRMTYEPVTASVRKGSEVASGDPIGQMELSGSHCYPDACLHIGLIDDATDDYLDPMTLFGPTGDVRLLPLWSDQAVPPEPDPSPVAVTATRADVPADTPAADDPN